VLKNMDLTVSGRYDDFSAVTNNKNFDTDGNLIAPGKAGRIGQQGHLQTGAALESVDSVLVRGSYGTGFKAPTPDQHRQATGQRRFLAVPRLPDHQSTTTPRFKLCNPGSSEYGLLTGGNAATGAGARPEESKQATLGIRLEPIPACRSASICGT
jgi:iron complex outermembrane receptor protein